MPSQLAWSQSPQDNGVTVCGRVIWANPLSSKPGSAEPGRYRPPNSQPWLNVVRFWLIKRAR